MHQKHTRIVPVQQISCTIVQDVLCKKGEEKIAIFLIYFEPVVLDFHADLVKIYTFFLTSNYILRNYFTFLKSRTPTTISRPLLSVVHLLFAKLLFVFIFVECPHVHILVSQGVVFLAEFLVVFLVLSHDMVNLVV